MGGTDFRGGNGGGSFYPSGQQGFGTGNGYMGGAAGAGMVGNGMTGNGMGGSGMGDNGMEGIGTGGYPMGSNGMGGIYPQAGGMSNGPGAGTGAGMGSDGTGAGSGGGMSGYAGSGNAAFGNRGSTVPSGYIRYNGQLMTIGQYQQALAGGSSSGPSSDSQSLSRRDVLQADSSAFFVHKRQADSSDGAPQPSSDGNSPPARKGKTPVAKVLMCINGDPAVPPIKFNTMTGMRLRDASVPKDGVVDITNLPNYKMPWMPFLPTAEMWAEQQELMLAQEQMIETNMTTAPSPSR
ncbi:hypothetical protein PHSY_006142 [Pseudozyma hubeiensis SY62]|uniref:Uncharacterized protein n=1 Tax=Pseudozyma hubeiensis (strain SY62) TaxID=1305764 RepID=R9PAW7_PSEHS|nr:hypothetical protein PHSY_006142 [Pseudozyma hubeiensis SY62]GAC98548.1 hypothetical protein PHSY_006142 [Pseudozyma hubeiensis SY62]